MRWLRADEVKELVTGYQSGVSVNSLAEQFKINRTTVLAHIDRAGIARRYPKIGSKELPKIIESYSRGESLAQVGNHFGLNPGTVRSALRKAGVQMRGPQGWRNVP
jgi:DNA-binding CsgD family transcriptional regulator